MQAVYVPVPRDTAPGRDERLPGHLTAEDALQLLVRAGAPEDVELDLFEVEDPQQLIERVCHEEQWCRMPRSPRAAEVGGDEGVGSRPDSSAEDEPLRSRDEEALGWGDERRDSESDADPDVARLLADRPPHHDRD